MACSSCRKAPVVRTPTSTTRGTILPTPTQVNRGKNGGNATDARSRVTGLKYVPK